MQYYNFIGIDVSKLHLDLCLIYSDHQAVLQGKCKNDDKSIESYLVKLLRSKKLAISQTLVCAEYTGIYSKPLERVALKMGLNLWIENPRTIKLSIGFTRGKSDSIDSFRIAEYSKRFSDKARLYQCCNKTQEELATLSHARESLIQIKNQILVQIKEAKLFDPINAGILEDCFKETLESTIQKIKAIDKQINLKIGESAQLKRSVELITSIQGIGRETALAIILTTKNFTIFEKPGQMACYAGVAPFAYESGTSIKRKSRVSKNARKDLKKLLHMAALCAIRFNEELKNYFIRKVKEGKNKMSVLNAIRNKLIHRIFAVIKRGTPFTNDPKFSISSEKLNFNLVS
jgi:transposase